MPSEFPLIEVKPGEISPFLPQSFGRSGKHLFDSIKSIGLLRPLILVPHGADFRLLSGSLRLAALAEMGLPKIPAHIISPAKSLSEQLEIALAENYDRGWNQAEVVLLWKFMAENLPRAAALRLGAILGLSSPKPRAWAAAAALLPEAALGALADESLDLENAARVSAWDSESRDLILDIFSRLKPSKQKKRQWLDWLEDLGRREKLSPAAILESKEIQKALEAKAEEKIRRALWRRRHPYLAELSAKRDGQMKALGLPPNMRLGTDPSFEDLEFTLNLSFRNHDELKALAGKLSRLALDANMCAMLKEGSR